MSKHLTVCNHHGETEMIVIEGMDNSGKSTLAIEIGKSMGIGVVESEGPPRSAIEINERVDKYHAYDEIVFVRHPCVSNAIYGQVREEGNPITPDRTKRFYQRNPLFIYCDAGQRGLTTHVIKEHDTSKHIKDITDNYNKLLYLYRQWAAENSHFVYRIGDDMYRLIVAISYYLNPDQL